MRRSPHSRSGRPAKFEGPRRPVTVTLPEETLARLAAIDADRARAIVKVTEAASPPDGTGAALVELAEVTPGLSVILLGPCPVLRRIEGLRLVEVAPARFLLSIPSGMPIDSLELALADLLEDQKQLDPLEYSTLRQLKDLITSVRRRRLFLKAEMLFVETNRKGRAKRGPPKSTRRPSPGGVQP